MAYMSQANQSDYGSPAWAKYEAVTADVHASQAHLRAGQWQAAHDTLNLALAAITNLQSQLILDQEDSELRARIEKESTNGN